MGPLPNSLYFPWSVTTKELSEFLLLTLGIKFNELTATSSNELALENPSADCPESTLESFPSFSAENLDPEGFLTCFAEIPVEESRLHRRETFLSTNIHGQNLNSSHCHVNPIFHHPSYLSQESPSQLSDHQDFYLLCLPDSQEFGLVRTIDTSLAHVHTCRRQNTPLKGPHIRPVEQHHQQKSAKSVTYQD
ncbi:hypothetical protein ES332_A07G098100v1 [Gossypium tomentosum]|uniref:Uncharacterized protein n=1 Tax=Gossypium tomentosum TaxID=34277 RepID=A0A5D2PRA6_GOSTO|nr:hypothetical protein ES332_A07G098100v1 [Gossypium tomentosum]